MIELKNLSEVERCVIGSQCRKFFLTYNKYKTCIKIFNKLKEELNLTKSHDKELWVVVNCAAKAFKQGINGSEFSLSAPVYKRANEEHDLKLNHIRATKVIHKLDELGYLIYYKGYGTPVEGSSNWMRSCLFFTDKLQGMFTEKVLNKIKSEIEPTQLVEIRCSKTKECILSYSKIKGIVPRRSFMFEYNGVLREHEITLFGKRCYVEYKQVFHDSLEGSGRIYTFGKFQTNKSELRQFIEIGGEATTEVDLSNLHISILRVIQGLPTVHAFFDQYGIEGYPRDVCKAAIMCMINCKTERGSYQALRNICKDSDWEYTETQCKDIVTALKKHNNPVVFFGKDSSDWKTLQRLDSMLCEYIVGRFIKKGVRQAILSYHDSWVVKKSLQSYLIESIKMAWRHVMKVDYDCKVKVEF